MDDVIVRVQQGRLRGVPAGYGYRFLGIPYARPRLRPAGSRHPSRPGIGTEYGTRTPSAPPLSSLITA